ncbi:hypothetical protein BA950_14770 [Erythrobacter sp. SAORIC-644]|jgi:hypothetical protein|uniref:NUMOD3 domain-containing DNA-binding protein n=1 Tax=Erythrobacter sp. SAORIC-644 TaxID=1869314 RepID=UPI000C9EE547|nr:NUMOD3 domain-containing DNA-binding protein [Erythrobacter sp. SAORIC-644]PNQ74326.1 hypothetical protein BA950_14770 [Erythrobacter sp. SAORIC-644]
MLPISDRLGSYLKSWHKTSTTRQLQKARVVELTYDDFLALFTPGQLMGLEWAIQNDTLRHLQNEKSSDALVLTWRSYEAVSTGQFNSNTAMICSRKTSEKNCRMVAGDSHTAETKARISKSKTGKRNSASHNENISKATKGVSKSAWTPERKAARRALLAAKKAALGTSKH